MPGAQKHGRDDDGYVPGAKRRRLGREPQHVGERCLVDFVARDWLTLNDVCSLKQITRWCHERVDPKAFCDVHIYELFKPFAAASKSRGNAHWNLATEFGHRFGLWTEFKPLERMAPGRLPRLELRYLVQNLTPWIINKKNGILLEAFLRCMLRDDRLRRLFPEDHDLRLQVSCQFGPWSVGECAIDESTDWVVDLLFTYGPQYLLTRRTSATGPFRGASHLCHMVFSVEDDVNFARFARLFDAASQREAFYVACLFRRNRRIDILSALFDCNDVFHVRSFVPCYDGAPGLPCFDGDHGRVPMDPIAYYACVDIHVEDCPLMQYYRRGKMCRSTLRRLVDMYWTYTDYGRFDCWWTWTDRLPIEPLACCAANGPFSVFKHFLDMVERQRQHSSEKWASQLLRTLTYAASEFNIESRNAHLLMDKLARHGHLCKVSMRTMVGKLGYKWQEMIERYEGSGFVQKVADILGQTLPSDWKPEDDGGDY